MTITAVYSNGTWGSVVGGNLNGVYAPRPVEGVMRTEEYTVENATIELTCPEPGYDPLVLQLGDKTFSRQVPNVSPIWAEWEAAGLLPDLSPIPEPDDVREAREAAERRLTRLIAPYDFQGRFTDEELVAIQTSADPVLIRARTKIQTITTHVDLDDVETQQLISYLQLLKILTPERAAAILE